MRRQRTVSCLLLDFTSPVFSPLTEHEVNGLDYRYVYSDTARLSVNVHGIKNGSPSLLDENGDLRAYYHCDYLTTDYLTSAVNSKVISWTSYNEWGEITHNAVLKCGQRELDLVKEYATHDYDAVLNQYYAKARFYDADRRRFTAQDPARDGFNLYAYVGNNPVNCIDPMGLFVYIGNTKVTTKMFDSKEYAPVYELLNAYGFSEGTRYGVYVNSNGATINLMSKTNGSAALRFTGKIGLYTIYG